VYIPQADLSRTFLTIIAFIQSRHFAKEKLYIETNKALKPSLQKIAIFSEMIHANSKQFKLSKAQLPFSAEFPALLPKDHTHKPTPRANLKLFLVR